MSGTKTAPRAQPAQAQAAFQRADANKDGRLTKEDVLAYVAKGDGAKAPPAAPAAPPAAPVEARAEDGREKRVRMSRLRRRIAERLKEAQNTAAMLTTFNEADMGAVMALRDRHKDAFEKRHGVKLGFMSFFVKACCEALQKYPVVNASVDGETIVYHKQINVGIAVALHLAGGRRPQVDLDGPGDPVDAPRPGKLVRPEPVAEGAEVREVARHVDPVGLEDDRVPVLHVQLWDHLGAVRPAVARVAADKPPPAEHRLVQAVDHLHHPSRVPFQIGVIAVPRPVAAGFLNVTVGAVQAQGGGKHSHGAHELLDGNALEQLNVLEDRFGQLRPLSLSRGDRDTPQQGRESDGTGERSPQPTSGWRRPRKLCCRSPVRAASSSTP